MEFKSMVIEVIIEDVHKDLEKRGFDIVLDINDLYQFDSDFVEYELEDLIKSGKLKNHGSKATPLFDKDEFAECYAQYFCVMTEPA